MFNQAIPGGGNQTPVFYQAKDIQDGKLIAACTLLTRPSLCSSFPFRKSR